MSKSESIDRQLQNGQQPDGELDESQLMAYDRAQELADQFADIETRTLDGEKVRGVVESIDMASQNGSISVGVDVPAEDEPVRFNLSRPKVWSRRYDFVRWVEDHGYAAGDFGAMVQQNVEVDVRVDDGEYDLVIPRQRTERVSQRISGVKQRVTNFGRILNNGPWFVITAASIVTGYVSMGILLALEGGHTFADAFIGLGMVLFFGFLWAVAAGMLVAGILETVFEVDL